ncbi:hypothetical protein KA005_21010, partial [bacterium]|nr:hypothetical protein [bacterium]
MIRFMIPRVLSSALMLVILTVSISAEVPNTMNYQGRLTNNAGDPVADIPHNITFKIYHETSTVRWEESHIVTTADGLFSVQLGSNGSPLTADVFNYAECWLGITVDTDPEITPRTQLNTVPYSFRTGSVQALDIVNEPGVAAFSGAYYIYLIDTAYTVLCSLTINCPAEGYVMAVAHGRIGTLPQHTTGTNSYATVGISDTPNSLPGNQDLDFHIDSAAPSGKFFVPFGMTSMFEVASAGSYTYYYLAYEYSGSVSVADMQFNLVYFPTAYGTVDPVPPPVSAPDGDGSVRLDGLTPMESDTKRTETEALNVARLERELVAMKAKIEAMQKQIDDNTGNERR